MTVSSWDPMRDGMGCSSLVYETTRRKPHFPDFELVYEATIMGLYATIVMLMMLSDL